MIETSDSSSGSENDLYMAIKAMDGPNNNERKKVMTTLKKVINQFENKPLRGKEKNLLSGIFFRKIDYAKEEHNSKTVQMVKHKKKKSAKNKSSSKNK